MTSCQLFARTDWMMRQNYFWFGGRCGLLPTNRTLVVVLQSKVSAIYSSFKHKYLPFGKFTYNDGKLHILVFYGRVVCYSMKTFWNDCWSDFEWNVYFVKWKNSSQWIWLHVADTRRNVRSEFPMITPETCTGQTSGSFQSEIRPSYHKIRYQVWKLKKK